MKSNLEIAEELALKIEDEIETMEIVRIIKAALDQLEKDIAERSIPSSPKPTLDVASMDLLDIVNMLHIQIQVAKQAHDRGMVN